MDKLTPHQLAQKTYKDLRDRKKKREIDVNNEIADRLERASKRNHYGYRKGQM